jgi:hypothetical protein
MLPHLNEGSEEKAAFAQPRYCPLPELTMGVLAMRLSHSGGHF